MRVQGNIWEDNWHNARPCPVRRQRRLFNETKEAEKVTDSFKQHSCDIALFICGIFLRFSFKVLHYISGLRPAQVATELISTVLQASIRRIENASMKYVLLPSLNFAFLPFRL